MIDYNLQIFNLSPHNYGIPQQRERIFFICIRKDIYKSPIKLIEPSIKFSMEDIIETIPNEKYKISKEIEDVLNAWDELIKKFDVNEKISPTILINDYYKNYTKEEFETLPLWKKDYMKKNIPLINKYKSIFDEWYEKYKSLLLKREIYGKLEYQAGLIKPNESIYNHFIQFRQSGIRVKKNKYFPTLVAIVQTPIFGEYKRYITPRECARLQNFPDNFILPSNDKIAYKQLGNSINVYNAYLIIKSTFEHYKEYF
jgi:DNA (cytosine-5)-methyltransferase 1